MIERRRRIRGLRAHGAPGSRCSGGEPVPPRCRGAGGERASARAPSRRSYPASARGRSRSRRRSQSPRTRTARARRPRGRPGARGAVRASRRGAARLLVRAAFLHGFAFGPLLSDSNFLLAVWRARARARSCVVTRGRETTCPALAANHAPRFLSAKSGQITFHKCA